MTLADDRDAGMALRLILEEAPKIGVDDAIHLYGAGLPDEVRDQLWGLTTAEIAGLAEVRDALGGTDPVAADNNLVI